MLGTLVNMGAVLVGSTLGIVLHSRLPTRISDAAFHGIGLFTLLIGVTMAIKTQNFIIMIFSIVIGSVVGTLIDIDKYMERFGGFLMRKIKVGRGRFSEGFVTAFLLFCMGSMTILGAIEEGLGGLPNIYMAKSVLDGFSSIVLSATFGIGVLFSAIPLLIYQGGLTLLAGSIGAILSGTVVNEITAVGGLILLGLGIDILDIKKLKVINMLPSLLFAGLMAYFFL